MTAVLSPARAIPRYFEADGASDKKRGGGSWANDLPRDVLLAIVEETGEEQPVKFASVCRGWRWLLDAPDTRRTLVFSTNATRQRALVRALRSFSLFVCRRPPVTRELVVLYASWEAAAPYVAAALAPALTHLAGVLEGVTLPHPHTAALASSPFFDLCARLEYLRCAVTTDLDLSGVGSLRFVDVVLDGREACHLALPDSLATLRARVTDGANPAILTSLLAELPYLHRLRTFRLETEHECEVDADSLPPTLTTLVLSGEAPIHLVLPTEHTSPMAASLEMLSLDHCRLSAHALARFLHG